MRKFCVSSTRMWACAASAVVLILVSGADSCKSADPVPLTIFHTNDLHSYFNAPKNEPFKLGGFARLSTLLKERRQASPAANFSFDAGDYSEANMYFNIDTGATTLRMLDHMGFDAACVGNHDYIMGPDRLLDTVKEANVGMAVLASNLDFTNWPHEGDFRERVGRTAIIERGGIKLGVIGLTTAEVPFLPFLAPLNATDPVEAAREEAKRLRPKVDVLIVVAHLLFETNMHIAKSVPGLDAVISGHSHRKVSQAVLVKNAGKDVPVVETGSHARFLGELKLVFDRENKTVRYDDYQLHPVFPHYPEDPEMRAMIEESEAKLRARYGDIDKVVAYTEIPLGKSAVHQASMGGLAAKAYRASAGADLGIEFQSLTSATVGKGDLTVRDLHDIVPHVYNHATGKEWTIKVWRARAADLFTIFTTFYTVGNLYTDLSGYLGMDGAEVTWKPKAGENKVPRITELKIAGEPIDMSRRYDVAVTDGFLITLDVLRDELKLPFDTSDIRDTGVEDWMAMVDYAEQVGRLTARGIREGGRAYTTTPDLAVFDYGISLAGDSVDVLIANDGLTRSDEGRVWCTRGKWNDFVGFGTRTEDRYETFAEAEVAPLDPLEERVVRLSWPRGPEQGYIGVRCYVESRSDEYEGNNRGTTVFEVI